jgi:HPt (histidine-containing phosphotransfer) domain-containing protein
MSDHHFSDLDVPRGVSMMGSEASLRKILQTVQSSMVGNLSEIAAALASGDVPAANRLLHAIKGYVPIFASDALVAQVTHVEKLSKTEPVDTLAPLYAELAPRLQGLLTDIHTFLATR